MRTVSLSTAAMHAIFIAFCLFCVVPILIVVSSSFTAERSLVIEGFNLWPKSFSLSAYRLVFTHGEALLRAYVVTVGVTAIGTLLSVLFSTMTAYTLSRNDFKHRSYFGFYIYFTVLFHGGLVPSYILATRYLHLGNTVWALFLPMLIIPWFIFLMRRFLTDIPVSLIESAKMDGASEYGIFLRIVLPISKPAIAAVSLIMALGYWNSWWLSLLYIEDRHLYTLQYLLYIILSNIQALQDAANTSFTVANAMDTPQMSLRMAMALLAAGPTLFVFPFFQRFFIKGMTVGAVKG
ncbi:carbohydrate ABC transporter permease [Paenibacillus cymbidii]|uniref:carbohydrate ABC transporter permease n=1 Tax=Paenibacillus cymbidii TaxID=1639034 RepID=UPI001081C525|nr:carbohydrate ABC transporter permease [Paenibacillus cymbidii]